ncbi:MAG: VCBS repeat-containing protein [Gelidibacter sp.]|nr:VCBS repeat-containing protein [Gelidibacter sp.]
MKKTILLFALSLTNAIVFSQVSSNSCAEAESATHITGEGTFSVGAINGNAPTPICLNDGVTASNGEWFAYTPTANHNVTVTSYLPENGNTDTRVHIYTGTCGALNCVTGNDDVDINSGTYPSRVDFAATANQTYYIAWDNRWANSENFIFQLLEDAAPPAPAAITFSNQTLSATGSKMGVVDLNGDFLDDIITIPSQSESTTVYNLNIYYQQANGSFVEANYFPQAPRNPTWSLAAGDYDGNGYNDIVFGDSNGANVLKANANGTAYSVAANNSVFTQRTNFVDINNDGHLDIFVCHDQAPSVYYINDGTGGLTFYQSVANSGLGSYPSGGNYASVWIDYDNDGDMDMFMAKCGGDVPRRTNQMYRNDGNGNYTEVGSIVGLDDPIQTWSAAWADYNNDGYMDCFVGTSDGSPHKMMLNVPNTDPNTNVLNPRKFVDVTSTTNLANFTVSSIEHAPADFDNDGYVDILSGGKILHNNGDMTFTAILTGAPGTGGIGDLNNDGFLDVYGGGSIRINDGNANHWIKIITIGDEAGGHSNRSGIGARVEINTASGTQIRDVRSGEGFRFMSTLNTHFGIGTDTAINYVRVYWPSGVVDNIVNPTIDTALTVTEGSTLGLPNTFANDLIIYPNPTKNVLNLSTIDNLEGAIYSVFDMTGKRVLNSKLISKTIDVSHLSSGNYILRIISGSSVKTQKFIKQ